MHLSARVVACTLMGFLSCQPPTQLRESHLEHGLQRSNTDHSKWQRITTLSNLRKGLFRRSSRKKPSISCYILFLDPVKIQVGSCLLCHASSMCCFPWLLKDPAPVRHKQQLVMQDLQDRGRARVGRTYCYSAPLIRRRFNNRQAVSAGRSPGAANVGRSCQWSDVGDTAVLLLCWRLDSWCTDWAVFLPPAQCCGLRWPILIQPLWLSGS